MYTSNNQVIFEEIYDENIQPTEEEIIEYANFLGIDTNDVSRFSNSQVKAISEQWVKISIS